MKLRIHKNSIRLRLSQIEVDEIAKGNAIHEVVSINGLEEMDFSYSLLLNKSCSEIFSSYSQNRLHITIPMVLGADWANSASVSLNNASDSNISILIEKDFQCLHQRPGEDESNNFPNPAAL